MKRHLVAAFWLLTSTALALPQGGTVTSGNSTLSQNGSTLTITQGSQNAVLNWQGFDIGNGETVNFIQPNTSALSINRISGPASQIDGALNANGRVWLLNPNGIMFGQGARVDVGGLLATTATLNPDGTLGGAGADAAITNNGVITAQQYASLVAAQVANNGTINTANATLAAAPAFAIDDSGLISLAPDPAGFALRVNNPGTINAHNGGAGGNVALVTQAGLASVVNTTGLVEASGYTTDGGTIKLTGGVINVDNNARLNANGGSQGNGGTVYLMGENYTRMAGSIQARGGATGGNGGQVEVSSKGGMSVPGQVDTRAPHGTMGSLTFDPTDIVITNGGPDADDAQVADGSVLAADGGATTFSISEQSLEALAAGTNILLQATNDITIAPLTDHVLTLATTGSVTFTADSDNTGAGSFIMDAADSIVTGGAALTIHGADMILGSLNTSAGAGGITLNTTGNAGTVTANGNLTTANAALSINGNLALGADVAVTTGGGSFSLNGDTTGAHTLALTTGAGSLSLKNVDIGTLSIASGGPVTLNGTVTTDNALDLSNAGAITLAGDTTLNATNGATRQNVTLGSANTVNGAHDFTVNGATVNLGGIIGGSTPLNTFTTNATGALGLAAATTTGAQNHTGTGGITLNGNLTTAGGNIDLNNAATLAVDTTLSSGGGDITLANTVNGAHALTLGAGAGAITIGGAAGGSTALTTLAATGASIATNGVRTTGNQTYTAATTTNGTYAATAGTIAFGNAVTLAGNTTVDTTGGTANASFASTVDGPHTLTVTTGSGATSFNGAVGGSTGPTQLDATGNVTFAADATSSGNMTLSGVTLNGSTYTAGGDLTWTNGGILGSNVALNSGGAAGNDLSLAGTFTGAHSLTLNAGGGDVYLNGVTADTLVLAGGTNGYLNGTIASTGLDFTNLGALTLQGNTTLDAGTGNLTLNSGNSIAGATHNLAVTGDTVTLYGLSNVGTLTLGGNGVTLNGAVSTNGAVTANAPVALGANLTTAGADVTFNDAVILTANSNIATAGGSVATHGSLDGTHNLTLTLGSGTLTADNAWGAVTPLVNLIVTAGNITLNGATTTGDMTLTGASIVNSVYTVGGNLSIDGTLSLNGTLLAGQALSLSGNLTLTGDSVLTSGGGLGNDITVNGNVTGPYMLTFNAGVANIGLTGNFDVGSLNFSSGNQVTYGGGSIRTASDFLFGNVDTIYLAGDTSIHAGTGASGRSDVTAASANTILASAPGVDLDIYGDVVTLYQIGDTGAGKLNTLYVDANVVQLLGDIHTVGAQTINASQGLAGLLVSNGGDITLNTTSALLADVNVQSNGGNVYFNQPINGAHSLIVDAGTGIIYINASLGEGTPLANFSATGQRIVLAGNLSTLGDLNLSVPATLAADSALSTANGNILINGFIEGVHTLTLDPHGGDIALAQGAHVANYAQNSPAGAVSWGGTGLTVDENLSALQMLSVTGALTTPGTANLNIARNADLRLDVGNLTYAGGPARLTGLVGGQGGYMAARRVGFGRVVAGSIHFNDFSLPLAETYQPRLSLAPVVVALNPYLQPAVLFDTALPEQE